MVKSKGCFSTTVQTAVGSDDSSHRHIVIPKCCGVCSIFYIPLDLHFTHKGQHGFSTVGLASFAQKYWDQKAWSLEYVHVHDKPSLRKELASHTCHALSQVLENGVPSVLK